MTTYGINLDCVSDITPTLKRAASEDVALAQAIARRITTPRGKLWYAPDYGYDVRRWLGASDPPVGSIAAAISSEARKDERVEDCTTKVEFDATTSTITIEFRIYPRDPRISAFQFTALIGQFSASLFLDSIRNVIT